MLATTCCAWSCGSWGAGQSLPHPCPGPSACPTQAPVPGDCAQSPHSLMAALRYREPGPHLALPELPLDKESRARTDLGRGRAGTGTWAGAGQGWGPGQGLGLGQGLGPGQGLARVCFHFSPKLKSRDGPEPLLHLLFHPLGNHRGCFLPPRLHMAGPLCRLGRGQMCGPSLPDMECLLVLRRPRGLRVALLPRCTTPSSSFLCRGLCGRTAERAEAACVQWTCVRLSVFPSGRHGRGLSAWGIAGVYRAGRQSPGLGCLRAIPVLCEPWGGRARSHTLRQTSKRRGAVGGRASQHVWTRGWTRAWTLAAGLCGTRSSEDSEPPSHRLRPSEAGDPPPQHFHGSCKAGGLLSVLKAFPESL